MIFQYINNHAVDSVSGVVPAAVVTTMQYTQQVPDGLVYLTYAAAASTLLLNVPKIWKGFKEMVKKDEVEKKSECCKEEESE